MENSWLAYIVGTALVLGLTTSAGTAEACVSQEVGCYRPSITEPMPASSSQNQRLPVSVEVQEYGGALSLSAVDVELPSVGDYALNVHRHFSTGRLRTINIPQSPPNRFDGPMGYGWVMHYGMLLVSTQSTPAANFEFVHPTGARTLLYNKMGGPNLGSNVIGVGTGLERLKAVGSDYEIGLPNGLVYKVGKVPNWNQSYYATKEIRDAHGNTWTVSYATSQPYLQAPLIQSISDGGRTLTFNYTNHAMHPRVTSVSLGLGGVTLATYGYQVQGNDAFLHWHETPSGRRETYTVDLAGSSQTYGAPTAIDLPTGGRYEFDITEHVFMNFSPALWQSRALAVDEVRRKNGSALLDDQSYAYSEDGMAGTFTTTVDSSDNYSTVAVFHSYQSSGCDNLNIAGSPISRTTSFDSESTSLSYNYAPTSFLVTDVAVYPACGPEKVRQPRLVGITRVADGKTTTEVYSNFDAYNRPETITKSGSIVETMDYHNVTGASVYRLGLVKSRELKQATKQISKTDWTFGTGAVRPSSVHEYLTPAKKLKSTLTYYTTNGKSGGLLKLTRGSYTEDYDYERGTVKSVDYPGTGSGTEINRTTHSTGLVYSDTRFGVAKSYSWDNDFRLTKVTLPAGNDEINITYSTNNQVVIAQGSADSTTINYDSFGRLASSIEKVSGNVTATTNWSNYNSRDQPGTITEPGPRTYSVDYDVLGRIKNRSATDDTHSFVYSADTTWTQRTETINSIITHRTMRDRLGRIVGAEKTYSGSGPGGNSFSWDGNEVTISLAGIPTGVRKILYDSRGKVLSETFPEIGTRTNTYTSGEGWLETTTQGGVEDSYIYDGFGRVDKVKVDGDLVRDIDYALGYNQISLDKRITSFGQWVQTSQTSFDSMGRPTSMVTTIPRALAAPEPTSPPNSLFHIGVESPNNGGPDRFEWDPVTINSGGGALFYRLHLRKIDNSGGGISCENFESEEIKTVISPSLLMSLLPNYAFDSGELYCWRVRADKSNVATSQTEIGPWSKWVHLSFDTNDALLVDLQLPFPDTDDTLCGGTQSWMAQVADLPEHVHPACADGASSPPTPEDLKNTIPSPVQGSGDLSFTVGLTYDGRGRMKTITHPTMDTSFWPAWKTPKVQQFTYQAGPGQVGVQFHGHSIVSEAQYNDLNQVEQLDVHLAKPSYTSQEGSVSWSLDRDSLGRLTSNVISEFTAVGSGNLYSQSTTQFDARNLPTKQSRTDLGTVGSLTTDYLYDAEGRLDEWTVGGVKLDLVHDARGNLTNRSSLFGPFVRVRLLQGTAPEPKYTDRGLYLPPFSQAYDANNRPIATTHAFDSQGRMVGLDALGFIYGPQDHLRTVEFDGREQAQFLNDGAGLRARSVEGSKVTYSVRLPDGRLIYEEEHRAGFTRAVSSLDGLAKPFRRDFIYHNDQHIASSLSPEGKLAYPQYYFRNQRGDAFLTMKRNHIYTPEYAVFSPYGVNAGGSNFAQANVAYAGHETGLTPALDGTHTPYLNYMQQRMQSGREGRFLSPDSVHDFDPMCRASYNRYAYARANPVKFRDPDGHAVETALALVAAKGALVSVAAWSKGGAVAAALIGAGLVKAGEVAAVAKSAQVVFDAKRAGHIFSNSSGHVKPVTEALKREYIKLFEAVASNPDNLRLDAVAAGVIRPPAARKGVTGFTKMLKDGRQVWVAVRKGKIIDAGINAAGKTR